MSVNNGLEKIRNGQPMSAREQISLVAALSFPAILAQLTTVIMQYIDTAMVGRLGAEGVAAIGLVSSSTWLTSGLTTAIGIGFSVQIAHLIGAKEDAAARSAMRFGLLTAVGWSLAMAAIGALAAPRRALGRRAATAVAPAHAAQFRAGQSSAGSRMLFGGAHPRRAGLGSARRADDRAA